MVEPVAVAASAIIVPVEHIDPVVASWRRRHTEDGAAGMPPHITLLYPFIDDAVLVSARIRELRTALGGFQPFAVSFVSLGRFASQPPVLYLTPDPATPFNQMTAAIAARFPDFPPYGGVHHVLIPHLTVAYADTSAVLERAEAEISPHLPLTARATDVCVMTRPEAADWQVCERISLV